MIPDIPKTLLLEPWHQISVKQKNEIKETSAWYFKVYFSQNSYFLLVTDLLAVWYHNCDNENKLLLEKSEFNSMLKTDTTNSILKTIKSLLINKSSNHEIVNNGNSCVLTSCMTIDNIFDVIWKFNCDEYGDKKIQATILRDQIIKPLMNIVQNLDEQIDELEQKKVKKPSNILHESPQQPRDLMDLYLSPGKDISMNNNNNKTKKKEIEIDSSNSLTFKSQHTSFLSSNRLNELYYNYTSTIDENEKTDSLEIVNNSDIEIPQSEFELPPSSDSIVSPSPYVETNEEITRRELLEKKLMEKKAIKKRKKFV